MLDFGLYLSYFLVFVAAGATILLPIVGAIKHPKDLGKSGMALGALVLIFAISYGLSGSELNPKWQSLGVTTEFNSKLIGAGLTMFYFVMIISILVLLYSEISKAFK